MKKAVFVGCMDVRHDSKMTGAIRELISTEQQFYLLTEPGGAGVLSTTGSMEKLLDKLPNLDTNLIEKIKVSLGLGAEEVFLAVHGSREEDMKGCGGYVLSGCGEHYETPEKSREFSIEELKSAAERLRSEGVEVPIRAFYVTFDEAAHNLIEEVEL